jgi:tetratricopeptide (TPR) repeat protein
MIGSLGRDRAEASGELAAMGHARPRRSETARELVTILPRRITREMPVMTPELAELPTPTPTSSVLVAHPLAASSIELPAQSQSTRASLPGSGVRALSRARRLLRLARTVERRGPGRGALLLFFLAAVFAATTIFVRLRRYTKPASHIEAVQDAAESSPPSGMLDHDRDIPAAPEVPSPEGLHHRADGAQANQRLGAYSSRTAGTSGGDGVGGVGNASGSAEGRANMTNGGVGLASTASVAGRVVEGTAEGGAGVAGVTPVAPVSASNGRASDGKSSGGSVDRASEAKALCDKGQQALEAGDAPRALELAAASLKLRRTARTFLLRAQAEQRLERIADALASIDAASQLAPEVGAVWEFRGRILWSARRREEAREAFERFLQLEPDGPKAASVRRLLNEPR